VTARLRTSDLAAAVGCSAQLVRDLEGLGVLPLARRAANGYREFSSEHVTALRAYRELAVAVGPVVARRTLRAVRALPPTEALARVNALHTTLEREREAALGARRALLAMRAEAAGEDPGADGAADDDATLTIAELAEALGVRASTLRFWEQVGLVTPERVTSRAARRYPPRAVREARITAALRAAGYGVPAVRATLDAVRGLGAVEDPVRALDDRLEVIARRTLALLRAGAHVASLVGDGLGGDGLGGDG